MIWLDVSEIKNWEGHHTGIQRVIHRIGRNIVGEVDVRVCYFDRLTNSFKECEYDFLTEQTYSQTKVDDSNHLIHKLQRRYKKYAPALVKNITKDVLNNNINKSKDVVFSIGDTILIPGAFWIYPMHHLARLKKECGVVYCGIMYDLVPIITPQFVAGVTIEGFKRNLEDAILVFDKWLSISESTKKDLLSVSREHGIVLSESSIEVIGLGVDEDMTNLSVQAPLDSRITKMGYSLFVSTIEARKNQTLVYLAHKLMIDADKQVLPTILVGKRGWLSDDIIHIIGNDPSVRDKIIWLEKVDDRTLRWLYENCAYTIYPSYYEGWGLPVAESLSFGKPCIASETSSIPEVAGSLLDYFSPYDSSGLAQLMHQYSDRDYLAKKRALLSGYHPQSWKDCASEVMLALRRGAVDSSS